MKMMTIRLLATCMIAGLPRSPAEGIQTVPEDEGRKLIDLKMAEDASDDVEQEDVGDGLDGLKSAALREIAAAENVDIPEETKKAADIAALIRSARTAAAAV